MKIPKEQLSPYDRGSGGGDIAQRTGGSPHRTQNRRDSDDEPPGTVLRFRDLKRRGIVTNWTTLLDWIAHQNFPPGFQLGPNSRAWLATDVTAWLRSRPAAALKERQRAPADT